MNNQGQYNVIHAPLRSLYLEASENCEPENRIHRVLSCHSRCIAKDSPKHSSLYLLLPLTWRLSLRNFSWARVWCNALSDGCPDRKEGLTIVPSSLFDRTNDWRETLCI